MSPFVFLGVGIGILVVLTLVMYRRARMVRAGIILEFAGVHGGLTEVYVAVYHHYRQVAKALVTLKKLAFQYIFHILVRVLYYVKAGAGKSYTFARNQFVRNAVKSKSSVSFFWSHLKEYKRQIEIEEKGK